MNPGPACALCGWSGNADSFPPPELQPGPCVTAHPVAVTLALLLLRAKKAGAIRRVVATIFEPASEHGQRGMDELHQQTVNLLSFQPLPKDVFDAQVAFNMVARYGQKSQPALDSVEARILRHYQKIAGGDAPQLSILLLQAPIFHGHALAVFLEMESSVDLPVLVAGLGRGSRCHSGPGGRSPKQREFRRTGRYPAVAEDGSRAAQWGLAVGSGGQSPHRRPDRGGMRREHDGYSPHGEDSMKKRAAALLALPLFALLLLDAGCGYHTAGHAVQLPENVKTIAIPAFKNETLNYRIEQMLTAAVVREFTSRTHYHILNDPSEAADATLHGTVLSTTASPLTYDTATGQAASVLVVVSMKVTLTDRNGKVLYQNPAYLFREQYEVSQDLASFFEEDSPAYRRLSQDFARTLVSNILEGF